MFAIDETVYKSIDELLDANIPFIKSQKRILYANVPCTVDIETSSFYDEYGNKRGVMYAFVIGINGKCYIGRTYDELWNAFDKISSFYELGIEKRMIFYIHNLSYEFQWFRHWVHWEKVFSLEERQPVSALTIYGIEFRCSYLLSGYSLENTAKNLTKYKVQKMVGYLDYKKVRHNKTPLNQRETKYLLYDGVVVMCYIQEEIESHSNNITYLELTKTGKVRKFVRTKCLHNKKHDTYRKYHNMMSALPITSLQEYEQLKRAFHGGFTHANSYYVNQIVNDVTSFDFTSSYPYVLVSEQFPMGAGELINIKSRDEFYRNMKLYCCLFDATFTKISPRIIYEHPISVSKCYHIKNYSSDNGRLVNAEEISITLTEQDFAVISKFYSWEHLYIKNFRRYRKNYLPRDFVLSVLELYQKKTQLKDVEDKVVEYTKSKEMINSCYGMCVTDIVRSEIEYTDDGWSTVEKPAEKEIIKYNKKKNRFLCYQWGVWVTAYAQRNLFNGIYALGSDYIYSDTDSVKFRHYEKHKQFFIDYNEKVIKKLQIAMNHHGLDMSMCSPKTIKGEIKTLGLFDHDGTYEKFKTLGAKRYMVKDKKGYSLTVSGVNKKMAIPYLYEKYGDSIMDEFKDGLIIPPEYTGKNIHTYIDEPTHGIITDYLGNSIEYYEKSSIHLEESGYELSLSKEFTDYLKGVKLIQR